VNGTPGTASGPGVATPYYIANATNSGILGMLGRNTQRTGGTNQRRGPLDAIRDAVLVLRPARKPIVNDSIGKRQSLSEISSFFDSRTIASTSRSTCESVWAAVHEMRSRFCVAAGRRTGFT